jgi:hypothetical protein
MQLQSQNAVLHQHMLQQNVEMVKLEDADKHVLLQHHHNQQIHVIVKL